MQTVEIRVATVEDAALLQTALNRALNVTDFGVRAEGEDSRIVWANVTDN